MFHIKSIFSKVSISFFIYIIIFLSLLSGLFWNVIIFLMIIVIHEAGHVIISSLFNWRIKKIDINICGGYITYDDYIDKPFHEELLVAFSGIFFQSVFYILCFFVYRLRIIDSNTIIMIKKYHEMIMLFNLLPIIPLDGSKILNVILNYFMPYKKTLLVSAIISFIVLLSFFYFIRINLSVIIVMAFIIKKTYSFIFNIPFLFNRFLLEIYLRKKHYKNNNYIKKENVLKFKRQCNNYILLNNKYIIDYEYLKTRYFIW